MTVITSASGTYGSGGVAPEQGLCWMRSCPLCNHLLIRSWPWLKVQCGCGWQWNS